MLNAFLALGHTHRKDGIKKIDSRKMRTGVFRDQELLSASAEA